MTRKFIAFMQVVEINMKKHCPFCCKRLKLDENKKRETWCQNCGASWVPECPKCKKSTWMSKESIYKHKVGGCGFVGKKDK